jgi:hypothetical protein
MPGHGAHIWICGVIVLIALIVVVATGSALYLLPALGCALMMWMMMRGMGGHGGGADRSDRS